MAKRLRQSEKRRLRNRAVKTRVKTTSRQALSAISGGDAEEASAATREAVRMLDRAARKGVIHKRAAARRKSRLAKRLNALAPTAAQPEAPVEDEE